MLVLPGRRLDGFQLPTFQMSDISENVRPDGVQRKQKSVSLSAKSLALNKVTGLLPSGTWYAVTISNPFSISQGDHAMGGLRRIAVTLCGAIFIIGLLSGVILTYASRTVFAAVMT